tara:strand:- start:4668 stop:4940 length:273 start_codon:yes stop_codon:yes gene_type:complete
MSIIISNISDESAPMSGTNSYEVKINRELILKFTHNRQHDGLAQCLRDAADAIDEHSEDKKARLLETLAEWDHSGFNSDSLMNGLARLKK